MSSTLPALVFTGSAVPREHHFEVFHDFTAPVFDTAPLGDIGSFDLATTDYLVDDLIVSRLRHGPQTLRRTAAHLDDATSEWVTVQVHLDGHLTGEAGGRPLRCDPDRVGVIDMSEPFATWSGRTDAIWVSIPRSRLAHVTDCYDDLPMRSLHRSSPRGSVLGAAIERLWGQLSRARAEDVEDLAAGIVETVDGALRAGRFIPSDRDLTSAIEHYVAAHLDEHDLGVDRLLRTFPCSRATLYRLFTRHGGVATHIRRQRLVRCFEELSRPRDRPTSVARVATRWGFHNPSHFHRVFVAMFGLPPSELSGRSTFRPVGNVADTTTEAQMEQFQRWAEARP